MQLIAELLKAWTGFRASMARQIGSCPDESRLLAYAFLIGMIGFLTAIPSALEQVKNGGEEETYFTVLTARLFASLFLVPLFLYGIAAISTLVSRAFNVRAKYFHMRHALFWALLVATPLLIILSISQWMLTEYSIWAGMVNLVGFSLFASIWANCIAEAAEINRAHKVYPVIISIFGAIFGLFYLIGAAN